MILTSVWFNSDRAAYKVVVFPEPVGPVTRKIPFGRSMMDSKRSKSSPSKPRAWRLTRLSSLSRIRMTRDSP